MSATIASRQIHLDFHTGPAIADVGTDFDARAFAQAMKRANVNSVTVFAKCHHGHLYFDTAHPARHPGLKPGLDLLGEQIAALHREGIRAPIYVSVQCDEYAADTHPEWIARNPDGTMVKWGGGYFAAGWQILDLNSGYQDYLAEQLAEILKRFHPVDGIFFDMCWDQPSTSKAALDAMRRQGLDPADAEVRNRHAHALALAYMRRFHAQVLAANPAASVFFNSRPLANLAEEVPFLAQVEVEALPTGGWGYLYFPKHVRFARQFGLPYLGMTARFHKSWADFGGLKPEPALEYETAQMLAHGARCSIGDQLHPRGTLDPAAYDLIGRVYARVAAREAWAIDARPLADVGVFYASTWGDPALEKQVPQGGDDGLVRLLTQLKVQFDAVVPGSNLARFRVLVLPDRIRVDADLARRLEAFAAAGGTIICSGLSGFAADGQPQWDALGVDSQGLSPFSVTYLRHGDQLGRDIPATDHVLYERGLRLVARPGTEALGRIVEPYFERAWDHFCSHNQTPSATVTDWPVATWRRHGQGAIACIAHPVFGAFAQHGNPHLRLLVQNLLARALPRPLLRVAAPTGTETTVMRQDAATRTVVHVLHYTPERRTPHLDLIEDVIPLHQVAVVLRCDHAPRSATLVPEGTPLPVTMQDGYASVVIPEVRGHAMVAFQD